MGRYQDPNTGKSIIGRTLADSMQVIVATKSREPGLLVGPRVKGKFASANWSGKGAVNLAQLLIRGNKNLPKQPDHLLAVAKSKGNQVLQVAQRDIGRLFDKIFSKGISRQPFVKNPIFIILSNFNNIISHFFSHLYKLFKNILIFIALNNIFYREPSFSNNIVI